MCSLLRGLMSVATTQYVDCLPFYVVCGSQVICFWVCRIDSQERWNSDFRGFQSYPNSEMRRRRIETELPQERPGPISVLSMVSYLCPGTLAQVTRGGYSQQTGQWWNSTSDFSAASTRNTYSIDNIRCVRGRYSSLSPPSCSSFVGCSLALRTLISEPNTYASLRIPRLQCIWCHQVIQGWQRQAGRVIQAFWIQFVTQFH